MKQKLLLKAMLLLCALVAGSSSVWATDVTFTFNTDAGLTELGITKPTTNGSSTNLDTSTPYTLSGVSMAVTSGSTATRIWNSSGTIDLRIYKDGTLTFTAPTGFNITQIELAGSAVNNFSVPKGETFTSGTWTGTGQNSVTLTATNTGKINTITVTYVDPSDTRAETTVTIAGNETSRYMNQEVATPTATVKAGETAVGGATVAWSSTNTSVATIVEGTGVITLVAPGTTTIKANYAGNASYKPSEASYTLNVYGYYASIEAMQTATASAPYNTTSGSAAKIRLYNALVTYVNGNSAYIIDESGYGALIFQSGHGFTAGKIITGNNLEVTLCLFGGATEIKGVKSTGVTTEDGTVNAQTKTIGAVSVANQSMMVKFENVIYNLASSSFTDNTNSIPYVDKFSVNPTLSNGGKYDVTGLLIMDGGTLKVAPIAAEGIVSKLVNPTSQWKNGEAALTSITINKAEGTKSFTFETNSDGAVTYTSTKTTVATIAANGTITPVGYGTTTIKASTAATSNYNADEKSFTLTVSDEGVDFIDYAGVGVTGTTYSDWNNKQFGTDAVYKGNTAGGNSAVQFRTDNNTSGIVTTTSGGKVCKITIAWNSNTADGRTIDIYGKNTPYTAASDLYNAATQGTKLGSIAKGSTELTVSTGNYSYIGIRSNNKALYLDNIAIEWDENFRCVETSQYEWATVVYDKALDFTGSTVKAYIVTGHNGTALEKTAITATVPANTPLLINADKGTYAVPVAASSSTDVSANLLQPGTGKAISAVANKTRYVLSVNNNDTPENASDDFAEFQKIVSTAATVPVGKAYLEFDGDISAPSLTFDYGDSNGINTLNVERETLNGEVYNLAGQRVANPTKGLYIVNGRKVVIK